MIRKDDWKCKEEWWHEYAAILELVSKYPTGDGTVPSEQDEEVYVFLQEMYLIPGLCAEAGEVASLYAKSIRDENGFVRSEYVEALAKELGDVLFFVQRLASNYNLTLQDIAAINAHKLLDRAVRGKIGGSGDNR